MALPVSDQVIATTLKAYWNPNGQATDNIFKRTAFLSWLREHGMDEQGGEKAVATLEYAKNSTFQNYSGYDTLTPAVDEILNEAQWDWKQSAIYIPMSGIEEAKNRGKAQIVSLLKAKTTNAERTAAETFEEMFLSYDGTEDAGKAWAGLPQLVDNVATAVGGIDPTVYTWWVPGTNRAATAMTLAKLSTDYNNVSYGADSCDFEITTQTNWERYEALLQPNMRYTDPKTAEAGFTNLIHRGAKVVWSDLMPANKWYYLNKNHIKLATLSGKWMDFRGFITPYDKDAKYGLITCYGALVANERRKLGVANYNA